MLSSGIILSLKIFVPFFVLAAWLLIGAVATFLLWKEADLFLEYRWRTATYSQITKILLLTILCIFFPPLPLYMAWKDGLFSREG